MAAAKEEGQKLQPLSMFILAFAPVEPVFSSMSLCPTLMQNELKKHNKK